MVQGYLKICDQTYLHPILLQKTSGTGLGLAMCKGIVEQSKGEIWFETKEGDGTIFYVKLPIVQTM